MVYFIVFSLLFIVLNILDWYWTKRIIDRGGKELNPVLKYLGIGIAKLIFVPLFIVAGYFLSWEVLAGASIPIFGVCIWNLIQLRKVQRV
jgi:hypothetical protein